MPTLVGTQKYVRDLVERVAATFLQAFLAALLAGGFFDLAHIRDASALEAAGVAGLAAVLSLVKGLVAKAISNRDSASVAPGV